MAENGYLTVRVYTSSAQLPIEGATVTVTQPTPNGTRLLATRITDRSGNIEPIAIEAPNRSESQQAGVRTPFTSVDITADYPNYERVMVENAQIFSGVLSQQNLELIPIEERPEVWNMTEIFNVPSQNL
ncbi:MAG: spore cortex-lytic protein [Ruminococcaceae bacterium]|nr:spore cortex-lytic protein [Oscillospiraceae bacterium]